MPKQQYSVKGPGETTYRVTVHKKGSKLRVSCNCPEARKGICCRHRVNLLRGSTRGLVRPDPEKLKVLADWLEGTDVWEALETLRLIEEKAAEIRDELRTAREALAISMSD